MKLKPPTDYNKYMQEILDGLIVRDWNPYRKYYYRLQFHDLVYLQSKAIEIYDRVHGKDLKQRYCFEERNILNAFQSIFDKVTMPVTVLELGAWNGKLASSVFDIYKEKIKKWYGFDICPIVITNSLCKHPLYHPMLMLAHLWELDIPPHDVFVCSHTFEHMDMDQVNFILKHQSARYMVLETPAKKDWDNFEGGHVNTASTDDYSAIIKGLGYNNLFHSQNGWVTAWEK